VVKFGEVPFGDLRGWRSKKNAKYNELIFLAYSDYIQTTVD